MSEYRDITDRLMSIMNENRTGALSNNLSSTLTAVKKGQYMPTASGSKPILYVRPYQPSLISEMGGNKARHERLLFLFSGGCVAATQEDALDDATNLMNNVQQVLMNHASDDLWGGNGFGFSRIADDDNPEVIGKIDLDPGPDSTTAHFTLLWSCDLVIGTDALAGETTGYISGQAYEPNGTDPLAYAFVILDAQWTVRTDASGVFSFTAVAAGAHTLLVKDDAGVVTGSANLTVTAGRVVRSSITTTETE